MGLLASLVVFAVNLLIGAFGIYVAARLIADVDNYEYAIGTALIGAIVWGLVSFFFGWIPLLGPLLTLVAWVGVINWRYPGGWVNAAVVGFVAWLAVVIVLVLLEPVIGPLNAIGVPGV